MGRYEFLMNGPAQRIREMTEKSLKPLGVTPKQYGVLAAIYFEGTSTQRSVSSMLKIDRTTMVQLTETLEAGKWVVRADHPEDRRCYMLNLTPAGVRLFRKAHDLVLNVEREFLRPLSSLERQSLRSCLSKFFGDIPRQTRNSNCSH